MIRYRLGAALALALVLAAAAGPGSASAASSDQMSATAHGADRAATGSAPVAWVVNQGVSTGSVTPINTATNKVIKTIPVSPPALDVVITPDGKTAFVSLNAPCPGCRGSVVPVSTSTYRVGKPVKVGIFPATMLITPDGRTLYVGDGNSNTVTPIHTATDTAGKLIKSQVPFVIAMAGTPDGKTVYAVNQGLPPALGSVTPINTATNTAGPGIKVGLTPGDIVITPDGNTAYVLNLAQGFPGKGSVTPINVATNKPGKPIPIKGVSFQDGVNQLLISPSGKTIYAVANTTLTPIDTATNTALPAIRVAPRGAGDQSDAITPDGKTIYIDGNTSAGKGFIVPFNTATGTVGKPIIVSGFPDLMAITPNGKTLYALCGGPKGTQQEIIPVNIATSTAGPAIHTGQEPLAIAISPSHAPN